MAENKKPSIFQKVLDVSNTFLEAQLMKSKASLAENMRKEDDHVYNFGKAVTRDKNNYIGAQGFQEKAASIGYEYQRQMAVKSSIIAAIIKTRQNKVANFSEYIPDDDKKGFKISLKDETSYLQDIKDELFGEESEIASKPSKTVDQKSSENAAAMRKADPQDFGEALDSSVTDAFNQIKPKDIGMPAEQLSEAEMDRQARAEMEKRTRKKKKAIAQFIKNCGELKDRPFESKRWSFDAFLRAIVWDSLTYDQIAVELVPKEAEILKAKINVHHFQPVDASTIRYASQELKKYTTSDMFMSQDILYPEDELKALEERDAIELDSERLENNEYKYVQVIRGRIQRAFTENEMAFGIRNPVTDLYANGYSISELELLVGLVTSHLQTEYYNKSYFQQGFSAKGILHIKANLNRSKLEDIRRHWNHMVKGNRNSFQTPIMSGMDEIQWIPLTQNHSEMEFSLWLNYLIRMICAIYQIDPAEIGYAIKDEGKGGISGDNTKEKMDQSKDKGLVPLMTFIADFINKNIIDNIDSDYQLEWTGLEVESKKEKVETQASEVKFKKTVNEIRAEEGLPPIKGADDLILDPTYFQWYVQFSEEGRRSAQEQQQQQMDQMQQQDNTQQDDGSRDQTQWEADQAAAENDHQRNLEMEQHKADLAPKDKVAKSLKIEYYKLG